MERRDWLLAGVIVGVALFALLAIDQVLHGPAYRLDAPVDARMTALAAAGWPIHPVGDAMSLPGSALVAVPAMVAATIVLLAWRDWIRAAWCLGAGTFTGLLDGWLKAAFRRPLPPFIAHRYHSFAFPSGHTMGATGTVGIAILLLAEGHLARKGLAADAARKVRVRAAVAWGAVALTVGVGRVLAQNHWLSDVLAAWALGVALACGAVLASEARGGPPADAQAPPKPSG